MAGEAVLSAFMQVLFEKLYSAAADELKSVRGVKKDLEGLSTTLFMVQALLEDAEEKQLRDKPVRIWLSKLRDAAYEMDELLDEHAAQHLRSKMQRQERKHKPMAKVSGLFSQSYHTALCQYKTAHRIKAVRKKLDQVAKERDILGLQIVGGGTGAEMAEQPQTSSLVDDLNVFGREKDREKIVKVLLQTGADKLGPKDFSVIPIVGMGGLGKTTLTQLVYNDGRVKSHFELRMWICVSENFDELKLTKETLQSAISGNLSAAASGGYFSVASGYLSAASAQLTAATNMNLLQEELRDRLKEKRFLLVLDDVWNENPRKWERFCLSLRGAGQGSKIIITTQNLDVGMAVGASPPYILKRLSTENCWNLFRNCAFVDGDSSRHPNLEEIGREIVKKAKGLPLAVKALGSLLCGKLDEEEWRNILRSEIWELPPEKNNILPALRLSYKHLPPHLKQCFVFCSVFHKDYVFRKEKLVQIWMALGYVQPQGGRRLEDIGNSYFNALLSRSFFQPYKGSTYLMHDAIHDLAQSISTGEYMRLEGKLEESPRKMNARHVSYSCNNSGRTSFDEFFRFKKLRTLLLLRGYRSRTPRIPDSLFQELKFLRVLDLDRRDITELPHSVGNLIQLRYLSLSGTGIRSLPASISKLYNLQTLKLSHCQLLDEIPKGVTNLVNLRHLEASTRLVSKIASIGRLVHLQKLEEFVVRADEKFSVKELKDMAELRGQLCIQSLENVSKVQEAREANLGNKEYLSVLQLIWVDQIEYGSQYQEVLEGLKPHNKLKELTVKGYGGACFPSWLGSAAFCFLETIHLSDCRQCQVLPSLGQLPLLKYLDISGFGTKSIGREFTGTGKIKGFPQLKEMVLEDMPDLEQWLWDEENNLFPNLIELEITDCSKLGELPGLPSTLTRVRISEVGIISLPTIWHPDSETQSSLVCLQIHECPNLRSLGEGLLVQPLTDLQELTITNCEELTTIPEECFRSLINLSSLHIYNCPKLEVEDSTSGLLPSTLKDLQITSCSNLIGHLLPELRRLTNLANLKITDCSRFTCFPDQHLPPSLKSFAIIGCSDLQFLPEKLEYNISLETIIIRNCPEISSLPYMPGMLRELHIQECPQLRENPPPLGVWFHIPIVQFDGERMTNQNR